MPFKQFRASVFGNPTVFIFFEIKISNKLEIRKISSHDCMTSQLFILIGYDQQDNI